MDNFTGDFDGNKPGFHFDSSEKQEICNELYLEFLDVSNLCYSLIEQERNPLTDMDNFTGDFDGNKPGFHFDSSEKQEIRKKLNFDTPSTLDGGKAE